MPRVVPLSLERSAEVVQVISECKESPRNSSCLGKMIKSKTTWFSSPQTGVRGTWRFDAHGPQSVGIYTSDSRPVSPVYGAFREAVLGPPFTAGGPRTDQSPSPVNGAIGLAITAEPAVNGGPITAAREAP